ncbi:hypothetical protein AWW66_26010 [Micromonospora rosaria]|uniref:Uncharacterized protein n=1 Tax=Micromonospora rosaria TaxID=47874 RepID=A0A136PL06_9ACTN|nr:hypothetical protein [Micromonospora rosaria]KXK59105.1 hypothetical protein AWW66_26010 [Micromonospora rosaria]
MEQPAGFSLALDAMSRHVTSARPDAPVRPDPPRRSLLAGGRTAGAVALRRLADRLEPRPAPAPPCVP